MTMRFRFLLGTMLVCSLAACSGSNEVSSGVVIPSAQASEAARTLYPPLSADAVADGNVNEYY